MRKILLILTALCLCAFLVNVQAAVDPDKFIDDDEPKIEDNGYIVSWLILDQPIRCNLGSTQSVVKDFFEDQDGEANLMPRPGDTVKIDGEEYTWVRYNQEDMEEEGELNVMAVDTGNNLDLKDWGGQGCNNAAVYLVTYLLWKKSATVTFTIGSDDSSESYFNGEELHRFLADVNWAVNNAGEHEAKVEGGKWNIFILGVYERGGEWGFSVLPAPPPDEVDNTGPQQLFAVEADNKLSTTWGYIKAR